MIEQLARHVPPVAMSMATFKARLAAVLALCVTGSAFRAQQPHRLPSNVRARRGVVSDAASAPDEREEELTTELRALCDRTKAFGTRAEDRALWCVVASRHPVTVLIEHSRQI